MSPSLRIAARMSKRMKGTVLLTVIFYVALMISVFGESAFWVHSFGAAQFGLPTPLIAGLVVTLFYLPAPWFAWHGAELLIRTQLPGGIRGHFPELRRSVVIAASGCAYFLLLMIAWIAYADGHGL